MKDPEVRQFVEKCLATVSLRLSARELLDDAFLQIDDCEYDLRPVDHGRELDETAPLKRQPFLKLHHSNGYTNGYGLEAENEWGYHPAVEIAPNGIELFEYHDDEHSEDEHVDISIKGKKREDGGIFLRVRISDKEGWNLFPLLSLHIILMDCFLVPPSGNQMWHFNLISLQVESETFISRSTLRRIQH